MKIRTATLNDLDALTAVEAECFPAAEAATKKDFENRLAYYADHFWLMFDENDKLIAFVDGMVTDEADLTDEMYEKALKFRNENIRTAKTYDEFKEILDTKAGYIRMMWCGDEACESQIKEETGATSRCIKEDEEAFGDVCPICGKPAKKVVYFAKAY